MALTVSCIIPAFNEGPRIAAVLSVASAHPLVDEVIVVDDASSDDTAAQVAHFDRVHLIRQPQNRGKSAAIAAGLRAARGDVILFLDSDLLGLDATALQALLLPVIHDRADATISLRGNAPAPWHWLGLDYLSGERAMRRALAPAPEVLEQLPRFGMEVCMNTLWLNHGARLQVIAWPKVASPYKSTKRGFLRGLVADLAMTRDILSTVGAATLLRQIRALRVSRVAMPNRRRKGPTISTGAGR
ncbi:MAG: glycosyltransferase family 2 protein [Rhodobacteraceae bacterium]|nr:glycosyltransferase family 2 protein [Paracoccaceae bacterium]